MIVKNKKISNKKYYLKIKVTKLKIKINKKISYQLTVRGNSESSARAKVTLRAILSTWQMCLRTSTFVLFCALMQFFMLMQIWQLPYFKNQQDYMTCMHTLNKDSLYYKTFKTQLKKNLGDNESRKTFGLIIFLLTRFIQSLKSYDKVQQLLLYKAKF